jgi:hypothetical protein
LTENKEEGVQFHKIKNQNTFQESSKDYKKKDLLFGQKNDVSLKEEIPRLDMQNIASKKRKTTENIHEKHPYDRSSEGTYNPIHGVHQQKSHERPHYFSQCNIILYNYKLVSILKEMLMLSLVKA